MDEPRDVNATVNRISMAGALALSAAVVAIPYAVGRMFRRWQEGISPFARLRGRYGRMRQRSERRREAAEASVQLLRNVRRGRPGWTPSGNIPSERR